MIGFLQGTLAFKAPPLLILDVNGVGYELEAPMTTFYELADTGSVLTLHTHLVVREDAQILYGFLKESDRAMFRSLIKVNGVGPKMALTILSSQSAEEFRHCIENNDIPALVRMPGVGQKTAERLVIEMRDKLPTHSVVYKKDPREEAISALCSLGYKPADASKMVKNIEGDRCEDIIRLALKGSVK